MHWENGFNRNILNRGYDYYQQGRVTDLKATQTGLTAMVIGSEHYAVDIPLKGHHVKVRSMVCECPYAQAGHYCKHEAAVLYQWSETNPEPQSEPKGSVADQLIAQATDLQVRNFLAVVLENDPQMLRIFKKILVDHRDVSTDDLVADYRATVTTIFENYADESGFIDYEAATEFANELLDFIDQDVATLVNQQRAGLAIQVIEIIYGLAAQVDIDDSDGELMMIINRCLEMWDQALKQANLTERQQLFTWLNEQLTGEFDDAFKDDLETFWLTHFQDPTSLQQKCDFTTQRLHAAEQLADDFERYWESNKWASYHLKLLVALKVPFKEIQNFSEAHLNYQQVLLDYADQCLKHHQANRAVEMLKSGQQRAAIAHRQDWLTQDSLKLKAVYYQLGDFQNYQQELWQLIVQYQPADLSLFQELKRQYSTKAWETKREAIFDALPPKADIAKLYAAEHLTQRLLDHVLAEPGLDGVVAYESQLKPYYPKELLKKYTQVLQAMVKSTGTRATYRRLTGLLNRMLVYPEGEKTVRAIVTDWQKRYPRRTAMQDELRRISFKS